MADAARGPRGEVLHRRRAGARHRRRLRREVQRLPRRDVDWADVVVFDDTLGQGKIAQELRAQGKLVVGGSDYTDRLEDDRSFGQEELKRAGVNIIPYKEFSSFDDAIEYVKANPSRYVIKPSGEAQNVKRRLFVGEEDDGGDVLRVLDAYRRTLVGGDPGVPAAEARHRGGGGGRRVLQRSSLRRADQHQFRAQEAVPRQPRAVHGRDGHEHVLVGAEPAVQPDAEEDGATARDRALRRLRRPQLHRQRATASTRSSSRRASATRRSSSSRRR